MWRRGGIGMIVTGAAFAAAAAPANAEPLVGIVGGPGSALVTFDSAQPDVYTSLQSINGLSGGVGEEIVGIDFRPNPIGLADAAATEAAKRLFAVSVVDGGGTDTLRLYTIDPGNGNATLVGSPLTVTDGDGYGVDFNHTSDRLRIVNDGDENIRVNPNNGARADAPTPDTDLAPSRSVASVAYDRVDTDAATGTTLYALSTTASELVTIGGLNSSPSPNLGMLNAVGATTLGAFFGAANANFDISPTGAGFATALASPIAVPSLFSVNLATGAMTPIGRTATALRGLAVAPASSVGFSAATSSVSESGGSATITVTRSGPLNRTTGVTYSASDGSASGSLRFDEGETTKTFAVPIANDTIDAPDRSVTLRLTAADALTTIGPAATLTITDDDAPAAARDTTAPTVRVTATSRVSLASLLKGLRVTARPSEAARLEITLEGTVTDARVSAFNVVLAKRTLSQSAASRSVLLKPSRRVVGKPRRSFKVRVRVVATDAAGNRGSATRTVTVRP